jgi:hypothetical protein
VPFGRPKSTTPAEDNDPTVSAEGKGRATPKRADARKARRTAGTTSASRSSASRGGAATDARAQARADRARQRQALLTGDERNLPARDAGAHKRTARDVIDSRFTIGQVFIIIVAGEFLLAFFITNPSVELILNIAGLASLALISLDSYRHGKAARAAVAAKHGEHMTTGIASYAFMRAMLPRRFRRPPPKVARGGALL